MSIGLIMKTKTASKGIKSYHAAELIEGRSRINEKIWFDMENCALNLRAVTSQKSEKEIILRFKIPYEFGTYKSRVARRFLFN